jgi:predicted lipid-binding transport protein (Tim44 family)
MLVDESCDILERNLKMDDGFAFFDIIIFAILAGYLVFQLRRVLGRKTGTEKQQENKVDRNPGSPPDNDNIVSLLPDAGIDNSDKMDPLSGMTMLRQMDPSFNEQEFITGSKSAFSWIVSAFASGNGDDLKPLLSASLFNSFNDAIEKRSNAGEKLETNIVSIKSSQIDNVTLDGNNVSIAVEFISDQIKVLRGSDETIIDGDPDIIESLTDLWTFNRNIKSSNPNWILIKTETPSGNP